jgi:uncharacterized protein YejL (UPF0352 family)
MWLMYDAPTHISRAVRGVPNNTCQEDSLHGVRPRLIWFLCFYLWGHLKCRVYASVIDNKEAPNHGVVDVWQTLCNCPSIFQRMRRYLSTRVLILVEDLLSICCKHTSSAVTHKLNVSGQMFVRTLFHALVRETRPQSLSPSFSYSLCSAVTHCPVQILISRRAAAHKLCRRTLWLPVHMNGASFLWFRPCLQKCRRTWTVLHFSAIALNIPPLLEENVSMVQRVHKNSLCT